MMFKEHRFKNANEAFVALYLNCTVKGEDYGNDTHAVRNVGFYIDDPTDNHITAAWRRWSLSYAEREWKWYLSQNRSVAEIKKHAPIWDRMHRGDNIVNSNYGYQWNRDDQLDKAIDKLRKDPKTRQAWVTIYDGKEMDEFEKDTPCTLAIGFCVQKGKLCMTVNMRSNDVWYGFCNDQYCFSNLQMLVAKDLGLEVGWYYHSAADMHVYKKQMNVL